MEKQIDWPENRKLSSTAMLGSPATDAWCRIQIKNQETSAAT